MNTLILKSGLKKTFRMIIRKVVVYIFVNMMFDAVWCMGKCFKQRYEITWSVTTLNLSLECALKKRQAQQIHIKFEHDSAALFHLKIVHYKKVNTNLNTLNIYVYLKSYLSVRLCCKHSNSTLIYMIWCGRGCVMVVL